MASESPNEGVDDAAFPIPDAGDRLILASFEDAAVVLGVKLAYNDKEGSNEEVVKAIAFFAWELIRRVRLRPDSAKGTTDAAPTR